MKHLTPLELTRLLDAELEGRDLERADRHLGECATCRDALAALEAQDSVLRSALAHDPGAEYFEGFAGRVEARIRTAPRASESLERAPGPLGWLTSPRGLAWAGAAAAILLGAGIVFLTERDTPLTSLHNPELMRGQTESAAPPAASESATAPEAAGEASNDRLSTLPDRGTASPRSDGAVRAKKEAMSDKDQPREALEQAPSPAPSPGAAAAPGSSPSLGAAQAPTPTSPQAASRVRRLANGEEVPERRENISRFSPPPPAATRDERRPVKSGAQPLAPTSPSAEKQRLSKVLESQGGRVETKSLSIESESGTVAGNLCGTVRDRSGRAVAGAQVTLADLGRTTTSDRDGRFCLPAPVGSRTLSVMALGFEPLRRTVDVGASGTESDVTLEPVGVIDGSSFVRGPRTPRGMLLDRAANDVATWPAAARGPAREAQAKMDRAAQLRSADQFDQAAGEWNRVLERVRGHEAEIEVRARLAESRYRAWQIAPISGRRVAAIEALTSYLVRAPMGAARDSAAKRLDRVKQ